MPSFKNINQTSLPSDSVGTACNMHKKKIQLKILNVRTLNENLGNYNPIENEPAPIFAMEILLSPNNLFYAQSVEY